MILVVSVPFEGHLNVLLHLAKAYTHIQFTFLIVGWNNVRLSEVLQAQIPNCHQIYTEYDLQETAPMKWTFQRLAALLPSCLELVSQLAPQTILYDGFAVEGYFLGKELGIPSVCSVPSFYHPYDQNMLEELKVYCQPIPNGYDIDTLEMVSDGPLIRGDYTIVWNHSETVRMDRTLFAGYPLSREIPVKEPGDKIKIFVSFGTVVMNHLWDRNPSAQKMVKQIIAYLERLQGYDIYVAGQGKIQSDTLIVQDRFDQVLMLSQCDLFITHGGNNSYQEALLCGIPMLVIPFFGDQLHVAESLGYRGISVPVDDMSTESDKFREIDFDYFKRMVRDAMLTGFEPVPPATDVTSLLTGQLHLKEGDLVFGSKSMRQQYGGHDRHDLGMCQFTSFSDICSEKMRMPRIIDVYHDVIRSPELWKKDLLNSEEFPQYIRTLKGYRGWLDANGIDYDTEELRYEGALAKEPDYTAMCISGIDYFIEEQGVTIHFLTDPSKVFQGFVTDREIAYINDYHLQTGQVQFYTPVLLNGELRYVPTYNITH